MFVGSKQFSKDVWNEIFKDADIDQDGVLSFIEFKNILTPLLNP